MHCISSDRGRFMKNFRFDTICNKIYKDTIVPVGLSIVKSAVTKNMNCCPNLKVLTGNDVSTSQQQLPPLPLLKGIILKNNINSVMCSVLCRLPGEPACYNHCVIRSYYSNMHKHLQKNTKQCPWKQYYFEYYSKQQVIIFVLLHHALHHPILS